MDMPINRILTAAKENRTSYGIYMRTSSPKIVEMLAAAQLDFIRIDLENSWPNYETIEELVKTAHLCGITPTVRIHYNDEVLIHRLLAMGVMGIILPEIESSADVAKAARAMTLYPEGSLVLNQCNWLGRYDERSKTTYEAWLQDNIFLSVQVEKLNAIKNLDSILQIPGLKMVQSGRGTLSRDMGFDSIYHPQVIAHEEQVVRQALAAKKLASVQYYPLKRREDIEIIRHYMKIGVQSISIGADVDLVETFRVLLKEVQ